MHSDSNRRLSVPPAELVATLLRDGVDVRLRLVGWSMKPLFPSGVVVQFSSTPSPTVGDVVLIRHPNDALVAHRIIAADSHRIRTKGDSCSTEDAPVARESIVGCAVRIQGRMFSLPLTSPWMRTVGLRLNRLYPMLVARLRALVPRKAGIEHGGGAVSC